MSNIKIKTLTPVHIGSGNLLQNNTDFVVETDSEGALVHIIDEKKILELIGEENIDKWILSIDKKESTYNLVKRFAKGAKYESFSRESIACYATNIRGDATLKEVIHNGIGQPYIPGSSIKGAIRTAILAALTQKISKDKLSRDIIAINKNGQIRTDKFGNKILYASKVESELFGKDPNNDLFRFIRVGDAYFKKDSLIVTRMVNLNIQNSNDSLIDNKSPQLIEAISIEEETNFQLNIAKKYHNWVKSQSPTVGNLTDEISTIANLFMLINQHTKELVEYEIEYWKDIDKTGAEEYIEIMQEILDEINNCKSGKSTVLRIGHGSGWRFITGAWTERLDNFYPDIPSVSRPGDHRYRDYDFPKSRRVDEYSDVLGFVKLTINE